MNAILSTIRTAVAALAPSKTTVKFEDRVRVLIDEATVEATAAYEKAQALNDLSAEIAVSASQTRTYASKINALAGRLEGAVQQ